MGQMNKYTCNSCGQSTTIEVPDVELGNVVSFGDKVPCGNCGNVGSKVYTGQA